MDVDVDGDGGGRITDGSRPDIGRSDASRPGDAAPDAWPISPDAFFVDAANGDDDADGSEAHPWKTLAFAFGRLSPGDELVLRAGRYREWGLSLDVEATATSPVVVRGYPGEEVFIDASLERFATTDAGAWEPVDPRLDLYRSTAPVPDEGYVGRFYEAGVPYNLVVYRGGEGSAAENLRALNEDVSRGARYVGPGFDWEDGHLFVRLASLKPRTVGGRTFEMPSRTDPNQVALFIGREGPLVSISGSHIEVRNINFVHARLGLRLKPSASDITLTNLRFEIPGVPVLVDDGARRVHVSGATIVGGFPPWMAWTDMKGSDGQLRPASHWSNKTAGVSGTVQYLEIEESIFERVFDGSVLDGSDLFIHDNRYDIVLDDMVQLGSNSSRVEIANNMVLGAGPSHSGNGTSPNPGTTYIHDNVIDASVLDMLWGKNDPGGVLRVSYRGWRSQVPFPTHTASAIGDGDPWKIYYNTIVFDGSERSHGCGANQWTATNRTGVAHEVYNNIIIDVGGGPLLGNCSLASAVAENYQIYDGNLYHRRVVSAAPLLEEFAGGDFPSLEAFLASAAFEASKVMIPTGWESRGVEGDPALDGNYRPSAAGPAASGAVDLPAGFPGARHSYRGAVAP